MKTLLIASAVIFVSSQAFAASYYDCTGTMNGSKKSQIEITFDRQGTATIMTSESEYSLDLDRKNSRYAYYADYGYDGYGGSVELRTPSKFGPKIRVQLKVETYSEAGQVGSERFSGTCVALYRRR
jgi:hypothetical protein